MIKIFKNTDIASFTLDEYNSAGGDSYVDDMYEDLRDKGLI